MTDPAVAAAPRRPASVELCSRQCGARCCRAPAGRILLSDSDRERLDRLAGVRVITLREVAERRDPTHRAGWALYFADHGGVCPFLDVSLNLCSIYADRPRACREFPREPVSFCLLWSQPTNGG